MENAFVKTAYIELFDHVVKLDNIIHFYLDPVKDYIVIELVNGTKITLVSGKQIYDRLIEMLPVREIE